MRILDEAVEDAVKLSHRYISGRQLPDKSVSLLDTACARVAIGHAAMPPAVEDCRRGIEQLKVGIDILKREERHRDRPRASELAEHRREQAKVEARSWPTLEGRWKEEADLVAQIRKIRQQLDGEPGQAHRLPPAEEQAAGAAASFNAAAAPRSPPKRSAPARAERWTAKLKSRRRASRR